MPTETLLSLLQFADGLFPAGAHAHSAGLETFTTSGAVADAASLEAFLRSSLQWSLAPCDAVAAAACWRAASSHQLAPCLHADLLLDAAKPAEESRLASRQMGRQVLRVAAAVNAHPVLAAFHQRAAASETPAHHACAFALAGAAYRWPLDDTLAAFLHSSAAASLNAALRLFPLGQLAAQRILASLGPLIARLALEAAETPLHDIGSFAPSLEIAQMAHASLDARLFRS